MIYRSKAPLRIGLAGGGTDVSPYSDMYGGAVLNAAISLYARASIEIIHGEKLELVAGDQFEEIFTDGRKEIPVNGNLILLKGVYNRVLRLSADRLTNIRITTSVDVPVGSGLGTSSTQVVALLGAFREMLHLPVNEMELAHIAYETERKDLKLAGGKQDQYAAVYGGINYMEFSENDGVLVNRLSVSPASKKELEKNLLLWYTSTSRDSSVIIRQQARHVIDGHKEPVEAMHQLKRQAQMMKNALLKGEIDSIGEILDFGFRHKKKMAAGISNKRIEELYLTARQAGATGGKISGAGGGGFMVFYCPAETRNSVIQALEKLGGTPWSFQLEEYGLVSGTSG